MSESRVESQLNMDKKVVSFLIFVRPTLKRSQFTDTTPETDRTIVIDCEDFRRTLSMKIKDLAVKRCLLSVQQWMKCNDQT
ncbi:hypothetical protein V8E54_012330 [Elaphomyces granulatus]